VCGSTPAPGSSPLIAIRPGYRLGSDLIQDPTGEEGFRSGGWFGRIGDQDRGRVGGPAEQPAKVRRVRDHGQPGLEQLDGPGRRRRGRTGKTFRVEQDYTRTDGTAIAQVTSVAGLLDRERRRLVPDPAGRPRSLAADPSYLGM
jgi:hypothetical protein